MPQPTPETLRKVRTLAESKRQELVAAVASEAALTMSNETLSTINHQLIDLNARIMTINYALGDDGINWGNMMGHIASIKPGVYSAPSV